MATPREFGPGLKALRERRGITLEAIATATKIGLPLLAGLERNDVSHWPKGIFRRAFFRDYAAAIGAPVDETLAEFLRFFPENGSTFNEPPSPLRMTLAPGRSRARTRARRAGAGLLDAVVVISIGLLAAWGFGVERSTAIAVTAVLYYPLTAAWLGHGLARSRLNDGLRVPRAWRTARTSSQYASASADPPAEPMSEGRRTAGRQRERSRVDSLVVVGVDEPEPEPIARLLRLGKGSAA